MGTGRKILFCDMDGTVARFYEPENPVEQYRKDPEFFKKLRPYANLVRAMARLIDEGYPIVMLSAVDGSIKDSTEAQKNEWLAEVFGAYGDVPPALYPVMGESKLEFAKASVGEEDAEDLVLLDDYSKNLIEWKNGGGTGVKALNEINGFGGKFTGPRINIDIATADEIYAALKSILD